MARDEKVPLNKFALPTPLQPVALPPLGDAPPFVTLAPGKSLEVDTVPWSPPTPGDYFARANWKDYGGPEIDPKTTMPVDPDPVEAATDHRPYRLRGAVFSELLLFAVKK